MEDARVVDKPVDRPGGRPVPVTVVVKEELARATAGRLCCRRAEIATVLRFADAVSVDAGRVVIAAPLDTAAAAQRLRAGLEEVFGVHAQTAVLAPPPGRPRAGHRWVVRVPTGALSLARRCGLVNDTGILVRGLPPQVVTGPICDAEAIWRGAVLAAATLSEPGKGRPTLTLTCPGGDEPALVLALTGAARRLSAPTTIRAFRGREQILINAPGAVTALLTRLGAGRTAAAWAEQVRRGAQQARGAAGPAVGGPVKFTEANLTRSAVAARTAAAQLARALQILDGHAPAHLAAAARARIAHPEDTLEQLGARFDPPLSKDTIAGRLRRLLALADTRAADLGMPAATSAPPPIRR